MNLSSLVFFLNSNNPYSIDRVCTTCKRPNLINHRQSVIFAEKNLRANEKLHHLKDKKTYQGKICIKTGHTWLNAKYSYV